MGTNKGWNIFQAIWIKRSKEQRQRHLNLGGFPGVLGLSGAVAGADPSHPPLCFYSSWRDQPSTNTRLQAPSSASRYNLSGQCHISHGLVAVPCSCSGTHPYSESPISALTLSTSFPTVWPQLGFFSPWLFPIWFCRISQAMLKWACWILSEEEDS